MQGNWRARLIGASILVGLAPCAASALEPGQAPQTKPGIAIGLAAAPLPAGLYFVNHNFYYNFKVTGPGVPAGPMPRGDVKVVDLGFLWVPGASFLGAAYSAYVSVPLLAESIDSVPSTGFAGVSFRGVHNAFIAPLRLQWSLGNNLFVQSGVSVYVPTGTIRGPLGNSNTGADYFTIQPHLAVSYVTEVWNLTAYLYYEHHTKNRRSDYTSGDILHLDLTATKQFGNWTLGPVAYYVRQTTADRASAKTDAALAAAIPGIGAITGFNAGQYETFAVGGLVGYSFGKLLVTAIATNEIHARAFGGYSGTPLLSNIPFTSETTTRGWTVLTRISYPLWGGTP